MDSDFSLLCFNCVVPNTQLVLRQNNHNFITTFEYFQDMFTDNLQEIVNMQNSNIKVLSKNGKFVNVDAVMRRYVNEDLYKLNFSNGRQLIATADHIMEIIDSTPVLKHVQDLKINDQVETTSFNIDQLEKIDSINLIDLFGESNEIIISNYTDLIKDLYSMKKTKFYQKLNKLRHQRNLYTPYLTLKEYSALRSFLKFDESKIELRHISSRETIDAIIPVDVNLGKFIGYILSEGYINSTSPVIEFDNTDIDLIADFVKSAHKLFPRINMTLAAPSEADTSPCTRVKIFSKILTLLFDGILAYKKHSNDIKLADWIKLGNHQFISGLLSAEIDGDGTVKYNDILIASASETYIRGLAEILSLYNISCKYKVQNIKGTVSSINDISFIRNFNSYVLRITTDYDSLKNLLDVNCFKVNKFNYRQNKVQSNLVTITSIERVPYAGYVYDFTTEDHYFNANGIISHNCQHIDLEKLFEKGFSTGHGFLRSPNSIRSYSALAAIAIQSSQNDMFGGQSLPAFDWVLSDGVRKSFITLFKKNLKIAAKTILKESDIFDNYLEQITWENKDSLPKYNDENSLNEIINQFIENNEDDLLSSRAIIKAFKFAFEQAQEDTEEETWQAMEAFVHNANTLASRAGAQVNMGL